MHCHPCRTCSLLCYASQPVRLCHGPVFAISRGNGSQALTTVRALGLADIDLVRMATLCNDSVTFHMPRANTVHTKASIIAPCPASFICNSQDLSHAFAEAVWRSYGFSTNRHFKSSSAVGATIRRWSSHNEAASRCLHPTCDEASSTVCIDATPMITPQFLRDATSTKGRVRAQ